jgi:hypothetical protein
MNTPLPLGTREALGAATRIRFIIAVIAALAVVIFLAMGCAPRAADSQDAGKDADKVGEVPAADDPYAAAFTWSNDSECSVCHITEAQSLSNSATQAALHEAEGLDCATCHVDAQALTAAHKDATSSSKMPIRLKTTKVEAETCLTGCHESLEMLAATTESSTALTDSEGKVVNPHELPQGGDHSIIRCVSCHTVHTDEPVSKSAKDLCVSCHHEDVFECGTCHKT